MDANFEIFLPLKVILDYFQCGVKGGAANGRIVGGQETEEHEYPWQVKLRRS